MDRYFSRFTGRHRRLEQCADSFRSHESCRRPVRSYALCKHRRKRHDVSSVPTATLRRIMPESTTAFLDEAGRPRLRQSLVAFIDILGFSNISTTCPTMEDSQRVLDKIAAAIEDSRSFVRQTIP